MNKSNFIPPKNKNDLTKNLASLIKNRRVSIFVDAANLYFGAGVANLRIDYFQLYEWFKSKSKLISLNYYTAFDPEDNKQQEFLQELEKLGYRIIKKPIKIYENFTKGNMDIELAVDAIRHKDQYDILILISGDGDFTYLIQALETEGKKIIVLGVGGFTSYELHQEADNYFFLNRISQVWQSRSYRRSKPEGELVSDARASSGHKSLNSLTSQQSARYSDSNKLAQEKQVEVKKVLKNPIKSIEINKQEPVQASKETSAETKKKPPVRLRLKKDEDPKIFMS